MFFLRALLTSLVAATIALGGSFGLAATLQKEAGSVSHEQLKWTNPLRHPSPTPDVAIKKGRVLFLNSCAHCHGEDLRGDEGPDLHDLEISDRRIFNVIKRGIKGEMPAFSKKLSDDEISLLLNYLRSL